MRSAVIHIGTEKTGTTTLQEFLHINRSRLAEQGVGFLKHAGLRNDRGLATYCMSDTNVDDSIRSLGLVSGKDRKRWRENFIRDFRLEMNELGDDVKSVIISSEHFSSRLHDVAEIDNLFGILKEHFCTFKVIVYLRRQDQLATSVYSTNCKAGGTSTNILPVNVSDHSDRYDYFSMLEKWSTVFGENNIVPRIYEQKKLLGENIIDDFSSVSGLISNGTKLVLPENKNRSLSADAQDVLVSFNKYFPRYTNNVTNKINDRIRKQVVAKLSEVSSGQINRPSRKNARNFYDQFHETNQRLSSKWFMGESIFSDDFSMYPEECIDVSARTEALDAAFSVISDMSTKQS